MKQIKKTNTFYYAAISGAAVLAIPLVALAQTKDLKYLIGLTLTYFQYAIYLLISFAIVTFVYNIYNLYFKVDADKSAAGTYLLFSVIGFFVILSFWGLVNIIIKTLNLDTTAPAGLNVINIGGGGSQITPGAQGFGSQLTPGAQGVGSQITPGAQGASSQVTPGGAGVNNLEDPSLRGRTSNTSCTPGSPDCF